MSCSGNKTKDDIDEYKNIKLLTGFWGWNNEQCQNNPISISFSDGGETMFHDTPKGMQLGDPDKAFKRLIYVIHSQSQGVLNTSIEKEDRRDSSGNRVSWSLVIQNEYSFCWHRSDWKTGACTKSLTKCR